jgi:hypothetical protein
MWISRNRRRLFAVDFENGEIRVSGQKVFYAKTIDYFDFVTNMRLVVSFV